MSKGINAVFKGMPLFWGHGYLDRALAVMERVAAASGDVKLSKDTVSEVKSSSKSVSVCVCVCVSIHPKEETFLSKKGHFKISLIMKLFIIKVCLRIFPASRFHESQSTDANGADFHPVIQTVAEGPRGV